MKTFRLIGMALLAVCVSFASCSDDDEPSKNDEIGRASCRERV